MKNYKQDGNAITLPAPYTVASGAGVLVGKIFGIAAVSAAETEPVTINRGGVVEHAKTAAQAWTLGALIYWDDTNKVFTTTATGNTLVGAAAAAAANPSNTGKVLLDGAIR